MHLGICSALLYRVPHSRFPRSNLRIVAHTCTNHTVPYRDCSSGWRNPRHFVPGYDHAVPLGRNTLRAEALIKLALMGLPWGPPPTNVRPERALEMWKRQKVIFLLRAVRFWCLYRAR